MPPAPPDSCTRTLAALRAGGVVGYPTEAVWGLGCDPFNETAVRRLLALKQRPADKGLILVAADAAQLNGLVEWSALSTAQRTAVLSSWPGPNTWVVPATSRVPGWIRGSHDNVAVRVSAHPQVAALCRAFGGPIVSTSANPTGSPPPRTLDALDPALHSALDAVLVGHTGPLERPTAIRDARTGKLLRG